MTLLTLQLQLAWQLNTKQLIKVFENMKAQLITLENTSALNQIRQTLKTRSPFMVNPLFDAYFDRILSLKNNNEPLFAIGVDPKQPKFIKIIYSIHLEYKFTRQLCKCAHIQELYAFGNVSKQQIEEFHKDLIQQLNCYKVIALNITENSVLKPNQKFMTIQKKASL